MNPIAQYYAEIEQGKVKVSAKVRRVYKHIVEFLNDPNSEWEYNEKKANRAIIFIEKFCKHSKGKLGGKPFILELWQKALVAAAFGIVHKIDQTRKYQEVMLIVARKNGKSTLSAAIGLYMMIADNEAGAECYAVATKKDQAKIIWIEAKRMVNKSPDLRRKIKPLVAEMVSDFNDSFYRPLGADSSTLDGLNVYFAALDEIHAWTDKNLYDVIVDGVTAREQPMIFITSTAGTVRECVFDLKYGEAERVINGYDDAKGEKNERLLAIIYEIDKGDDFKDSACWQKANPGLGTIKSLDQLQAKVEKAKNNVMLVSNLLCKDFNVRSTVSEALLTFDQLNNETTFNIKELKPRYGILGVDLSITTDLTAACMLFMVPNDKHIYCNHMYWMPEDLIEEREKDDKIPYRTWAKLGYIRTTPGNKVDYRYIVEWVHEMQDDHDIYLAFGGYDSYSAQYFIKDMQNDFGAEVMEPVIQGYKTLSGPLRTLVANLDSKLIVYNNNPVTKWCLSNVSVQKDRNDNWLPCKVNNQRRRIDGFAAMLDAMVVLERHQEDYLSMI